MNKRKSRAVGQFVSSVGGRYYVGSVGLFAGGLPGEKVTFARGEIVKIAVFTNFAVITIRKEDGSTAILRK